MPEAKGKGARAIEGVAGRLLQDFERFGAGDAVSDRAANLHQQHAQRLPNFVVHVAREPLPFHGQLALAPAVAQALILEPPRDPHDVRDPTGDQFQEGDALRRQRPAA